MDDRQVPEMLKWVEWVLRTPGILTERGKMNLHAALETKIGDKYVGRFEVQPGFVCNRQLDILDRVDQHEWEIVLNTEGLVRMQPIPSVWVSSFAVQSDTRFRRYLSMMRKTGTPPGVLRAICDHEYIEAKKVADGQGFMKCDVFRPMDVATELMVTQCYWAYYGTFSEETDERRNGVYAIKCIKYFLKVMDFIRRSDETMEDMTIEDVESAFEKVKSAETLEGMGIVPLVSLEWLVVVFGMSGRALAALEEINLCTLDPIDARYMILLVLADPRFLALKDRPTEQALALYVRSTYPNVGEDHQEAEWDLFTENDLVDHWPAILLQARHGMIVRERLGRIVPEHEWPQTLVDQVDFFTYKGATMGVHKFCVHLHLMDLESDVQCLLEAVDEDLRDSAAVKEQLEIISCRPIDPIVEILRKEARLREPFRRWEAACKKARKMFEEGGEFRPAPILETPDASIHPGSAASDLDDLCARVDGCGVDDIPADMVPLKRAENGRSSSSLEADMSDTEDKTE